MPLRALAALGWSGRGGATMKLILVEDDDAVRFTVRDALEEHGYDVVECSDGLYGLRAIETEPFDVLLTDVKLPGVDGISLFRRARQVRPGAGVVLMTAYANMDDAVAVMREGARDYVAKPFDMDELLLRVARVREEVQVRRSMETGNAAPVAHALEGTSPEIQTLGKQIETASASDAAVLITGEMGAGKQLCGRTIHARSRRWTLPFVVFDCASIGDDQFGLELFGAEEQVGQTRKRRPGRLEDANGGTLFLEEVGALSLSAQAKLLRTIESSMFYPEGSSLQIRVNVRLMASTRRDLAARVEQGRFNRELHLRLAVLEAHVPPLRARREDLPALVGRLLSEIAARNERSAPVLDSVAAAALMKWDFPGNLSELLHTLERAVALSDGDTIRLSHLPADIATAPDRADRPPLPAEGTALQPLGDAVARFEREYIQRALEQVGGHKTRAAALLGISRKTLWERLREDGGDDD